LGKRSSHNNVERNLDKSGRGKRKSASIRAVPVSEGAVRPAASVDLGAMRDSVSFQLRYASWAVHAAFAEHFSPADAVPRQYSVLYLVSLNPGINVKALAAAIGVDQSTLVPTINVCEEKGWIARRRSKPDRRITALELTQDGHATLEDLSNKLDAHEAMVTTGLSAKDRRQLLTLLKTIRSNAASGPSASEA
jgi:DNA-binding MarR family transcriptional regulator